MLKKYFIDFKVTSINTDFIIERSLKVDEYAILTYLPAKHLF